MSVFEEFNINCSQFELRNKKKYVVVKLICLILKDKKEIETEFFAVNSTFC